MHRTKTDVDIVWFKRDLRITDHKPLCDAQSQPHPMILLYIFEPSIMSAADYGSNHLAFVTDSLNHLRKAIARRGGRLHLFVGEVTEVLCELQQLVNIVHLRSHQEVGNNRSYSRDKALRGWCRRHRVPWVEYSTLEVQRPHPSRDHWAANWEAAMQQAPHRLSASPLRCLPLPALERRREHPPDHRELGKPPPSPLRQPNRRGDPIGLLDSFLHHRAHDYQRSMSSPLLAPRSCSRMSPHLSYGTASIREVVQHTRHVLERTRLNETHRRSIRAFVSRLHWRGHFMQKLEDQTNIEWRCLDPRTEGLRVSGRFPERLAAWEAGQTGVPMVDACMRSLRATGWLNFRMRAMLVSFAAYQLWLDWREIHPHLARVFTDYEPGIHLCQLQMQSGTTGINSLRIYNPVKQGKDWDPNGDFVRRWVPEVAGRDNERIHVPTNLIQQTALFGQPEAYAAPIVDVLQTARQARDALAAVRRNNRDVVQPILKKHGSRRPRSRRQRHTRED